MPPVRPRIVVILVSAVFLIAGCGDLEEFDTPAGGTSPTNTPEAAKSPTPEAPPTNTLEPAPNDTSGGVGPTEVTEPWLGDRNEYGILAAWMEAAERATFAGGFIEHEPEYRYVVLFTRDAEEALYRYVIPGSELDEFIEVRPAQFSLGDFSAIEGEMSQLFRDLGYFPPAATVNIPDNRLEYLVDDPAFVTQLLADAGITVPEVVDLIAGGGSLVSLNAPAQVSGVYIAILRPQLPVDRDSALWEYTGTMVVEDGCLWVIPGQQDQRVLPIWNDSHRLQVDGGTIDVVNSNGVTVARVGEPVYLNGIEFNQDWLDRDELYTPPPEGCEPERVLEVISIDPLDHQPDMARREPGYSPFDLFSVQWPVNYAEAESLASLFPEHLGEPGIERWSRREDSGRLVIGYGSQDDPGAPRLSITDLTTGAYFPDYWTVNDLIASQLMRGTGRDNGFSQDTSWALEDTSITGRIDRYGSVPMHALTWGANDGRVLFTASAADYAQLEMLVTAVVAAVGE